MVKIPSDAPPSDIVRVALSQAEAAHAAIAYVQQDIDRTERALAKALTTLRAIEALRLDEHTGPHTLAMTAMTLARQGLEAIEQDQPTEPPA